MRFKKIFDWKYAIREVLLIVIGISIAFTLNNWNHKRNLRNAEVEILKEFRETLKADAADIDGNVDLYAKCVNSVKTITKAFDNNLSFNDSLILHFSVLPVNPMFFRNDGPYEVLKSKGFDLITNETLRLKIIDLYSVKYRVLDHQETVLPQFQGFENLFGYIEKNFKKSKQENFSDIYSVSIEPIDFDKLKSDQQFRLLIEHISYWNGIKIWFYGETKDAIQELQKLIQIEIDKLT